MYLNSNQVAVYPASKRDKAGYVSSRVTTEKNISSNIRSLINRSYIIEGIDCTVVGSSLNITSGSFILGGYRFDIVENITYPNIFSGPIGSILSFKIKVRVTNNYNDELVGFDSDPLDAVTQFQGLKLEYIDSLEDIVDKTTPGIIIYSLPLVQILSSTEIDLLEDDFGNRLFKMGIDANNIYLKADSNEDINPGEQSLYSYLKKYMYIDDGDVDEI